MAPFRVLRRGATRCKRLHFVSPPHGGDRNGALSSRRFMDFVTIGRVGGGARREPLRAMRGRVRIEIGA